MKLKKYSKGGKYKMYVNGGTVSVVKSDPPKKEAKSDLQTFLDYTISKKGGKADDYIKLQDVIAFHETGARQRMSPTAIQEVAGKDGNLERSGVGRGLFMFEAGEGAGGITAVNRTYNEYKQAGLNIPSWLDDLYKEKSLDASKLTADQQRILFLGNYLQHPKANLGDVVSGKMSYEDFWGKYHHAGGGTTDYGAFRESYNEYLKK
jgi:hypothetical protein